MYSSTPSLIRLMSASNAIVNSVIPILHFYKYFEPFFFSSNQFKT